MTLTARDIEDRFEEVGDARVVVVTDPPQALEERGEALDRHR